MQSKLPAVALIIPEGKGGREGGSHCLRSMEVETREVARCTPLIHTRPDLPSSSFTSSCVTASLVPPPTSAIPTSGH